MSNNACRENRLVFKPMSADTTTAYRLVGAFMTLVSK